MPLDILYEDPHLIVVNKPAPLLTQAPPHLPSLESMVKAYIKEKCGKPAGVYLGVPHRLDRPVTGVVCFTRNTKASQRVHEQFEKRTVVKVYWAIVQGHVAPDEGMWEDWMRKMPEESRTVKAESGESGAKLAILDYRVLRVGDGQTLIELRPRTGRMHQLRVQCAWRGHPVLGDSTYADSPPFGPPAEQPRDRVIALHARRLEIEHPFAKSRLRFEAPLSRAWSKVDSFSDLENETLISPSSDG
jgi:23S rRNA pseudouridine1911/1915/1917 synthase